MCTPEQDLGIITTTTPTQIYCLLLYLCEALAFVIAIIYRHQVEQEEEIDPRKVTLGPRKAATVVKSYAMTGPDIKDPDPVVGVKRKRPASSVRWV